MADFSEVNQSIIERRWPGLLAKLTAASQHAQGKVELVEGQQSTLSVNGVQLTSRHDRVAEARQQLAQLPEGARHFTLYGTGLGDIQMQALGNSQLTRLDVVVLNEAIFLLVLSLLDHRQWLDDPRVNLQLAAELDDIASPFVVYPAELELASAGSRKIRERLVTELEGAMVRQRFAAEIAKQMPAIEDKAPLFSQDGDVKALFGQLKSASAIIVAPGPSLAEQYAFLKTQQPKVTLIAVDTAVKPLVAKGIYPDIVVTLDARITPEQLPALDIPLVYFPLTPKHLLDAWPGPRYLAMSESEAYQPLRKRWPKTTLFTYGSVVHPAIDLAVKMGAREITLIGTDFAFSQQRTHTGWQDGELGLGHQQTVEWTVNGRGEKVKTLRNLMSYLVGVERYIAAHPAVQFYNGSLSGAVIQGAPPISSKRETKDD
ncbi:motility associated factor glycosyltransferase family protein [Gallaecimonas mangrovi]|uniref:motility associated factor glycosyltransferase family protein n=1 Tax=Gallaecimonas mangrovi TaxID=2291597 RepID=UPI000E203ADC|nr:6-hydroxymethylpterin diphosphokinase MptE-like protein [Gallaecimonas mangrovi]